MSKVKAMLACPNLSETTLALTPVLSRNVAWVCRKSWNLRWGRSASFSTFEKVLVTVLDYSGVIMCFGYEMDAPTAPGPTPMCDFNNDGYVTGLDYSRVIMNFGLGGADIE